MAKYNFSALRHEVRYLPDFCVFSRVLGLGNAPGREIALKCCEDDRYRTFWTCSFLVGCSFSSLARSLLRMVLSWQIGWLMYRDAMRMIIRVSTGHLIPDSSPPLLSQQSCQIQRFWTHRRDSCSGIQECAVLKTLSNARPQWP